MCSKGRNQVEPAAGAGESGTGWNGRERWPGRYRRSGGMRRSGVGGTARWAGEQMPAERQGRQMPAGSGRMSRRVRYRRNGGWPGGQMPAGRREDQVRSVPGRTAGWAGPGGAGRNGTKSREGRCRLEAAGRAGQVEVTPTGSTSGSRTHEQRIRTHIKNEEGWGIIRRPRGAPTRLLRRAWLPWNWEQVCLLSCSSGATTPPATHTQSPGDTGVTGRDKTTRKINMEKIRKEEEEGFLGEFDGFVGIYKNVHKVKVKGMIYNKK